MAIATVGSFEGLRRAAYRDPVGIPTICFGETRGVKMGQKKTTEECNDLLEDRLYEFNRGVNACTRVPLSESRRAALVSFTYNVGIGAYCKSTLAAKINAGDPRACDELLKWNKAGGIPLPGLTRRREEERRLCME